MGNANLQPSRSERIVLFLVAVVATSVVNVAPAHGKPLERARFNAHVETTHFDFCDSSGMTVLEVLDAEINLIVVSRGSEKLPAFQSNAHGSLTWTNLASQQTVTSVFNIADQDHRVTDNGDGTLTVIVKSNGGDRWYGPDGRLLFREPGQTRYELLVDHGGTPNDPFDDEVLEFVGLLKESTGRNDLQGRDFCDDMLSLLR